MSSLKTSYKRSFFDMGEIRQERWIEPAFLTARLLVRRPHGKKKKNQARKQGLQLRVALAINMSSMGGDEAYIACCMRGLDHSKDAGDIGITL